MFILLFLALTGAVASATLAYPYGFGVAVLVAVLAGSLCAGLGGLLICLKATAVLKGPAPHKPEFRL
jgi:divalent metal cation (Fe/Co/Zn/Cd) transporter